jgi:hypothetical protein
MAGLTNKEACAQDVTVTEDEIEVRLTDGRRIAAPLIWYPRLLHASTEQRDNWQLLGNGEGIHWPDIDEDLSVEGLLRGSPSPEARRARTHR